MRYLLPVLTLLLAGCGDGGGEKAPPLPPIEPTKGGGKKPPPPPPPPPAGKATNYLYYAAGDLSLMAGGHVETAGFTGVVALLTDNQFDVWVPGLTRDAVLTKVRAARQAAGPVDLWLAVRVHSDRVADSHMVPWDDDAQWSVVLQHFRWLSEAAAEVGAAGVMLDAENYLASPGGGGGSQDPAIAWPDHPRVPERARQWLAAVRSSSPTLGFGHYCTYKFALHLAGYFAWWRAIPGGLMLYEDGFTAMDRDYPRLNGEIESGLLAEPSPGLALSPYGAQYSVTYVTNAYRMTVPPMATSGAKTVWFYPRAGAGFLRENPREAAALKTVLAELKGTL